MNILSVIKQKAGNTTDLNKKGISIFLNPFTYLKVRKNQELLDACDRIFIDGQWLCNFLSWFGVIKVARCSFDNTSAAPIVFNMSNKNKESLIFIGSDEKSADKFNNYIKSNYPNINIKYYRNGYFESEDDYQNTLDLIVSANPDLVVVGMGFIKQENFLINLFKQGYDGKAFTCGGFIHQTANKGYEYYPAWIDKFNLRFLYRMWDEPKLIRRYSLDYSLFVFTFFYDLLQISYKGKK